MTAVESDAERDERFAPGNDRIWGASNWVRCSICPTDSNGRQVYHHVDHHRADEREASDG